MRRMRPEIRKQPTERKQPATKQYPFGFRRGNRTTQTALSKNTIPTKKQARSMPRASYFTDLTLAIFKFTRIDSRRPTHKQEKPLGKPPALAHDTRLLHPWHRSVVARQRSSDPLESLLVHLDDPPSSLLLVDLALLPASATGRAPALPSSGLLRVACLTLADNPKGVSSRLRSRLPSSSFGYLG